MCAHQSRLACRWRDLESSACNQWVAGGIAGLVLGLNSWAADWPQWRGAGRDDGQALDNDIPCVGDKRERALDAFSKVLTCHDYR